MRYSEYVQLTMQYMSVIVRTCSDTFAIIGAPLAAAGLVTLVVAILICCLCKGESYNAHISD